MIYRPREDGQEISELEQVLANGMSKVVLLVQQELDLVVLIVGLIIFIMKQVVPIQPLEALFHQ